MFMRVSFAVLCALLISTLDASAQSRITASTMDSLGNAYVTGWRTVGARWEISTTKYDKDGAWQWTDAYPDDPTKDDAEGWGIAVDAEGNVYVAAHVGTQKPSEGDCLLIKYPAGYLQGDAPEWVRTWGTPVGWDQNWTIALDSDGHIYVTGYSTQIHDGVTAYDIVTMKYDSQGNLLWNRLYNGPANSGEQACAIAVDPLRHNVYITGFTNVGGARNIVTIMYDSAGTEQWVRRYTGPVSMVNKGSSLALDTEGSVYVTGFSMGAASVDFATIKYNLAGDEVWAARYDGPGGGVDQTAPPTLWGLGGGTIGSYLQTNQGIIVTTEVLDPAPEIPYLTARVRALGLNQGLTNSLLAKLQACAASLAAANAWQRRDAANVLGAFKNQLQDLADEGLVPGDLAGELRAVATQIAKGILGTPTTVVYVTGLSTNADGNADFATIKYNGDDGRPMWNLPGQPGTTAAKPGNPANIALRYSGPANGIDWAFAMAMNVDGDLYVAGPSMEDAARGVDFFTVKYFVNTYQPAVLAQARYNGPGNGVDQACGFATWRDPVSGRNVIFRDPVTGQDYVGVTGNSIATGGLWDYMSIMYDGNLGVRWMQRY